MRYLAVELAPAIRVNAVSAGVVETGALEHFPNKDEMLRVGKANPVGRLVTPDDVAGRGRVPLLAGRRDGARPRARRRRRLLAHGLTRFVRLRHTCGRGWIVFGFSSLLAFVALVLPRDGGCRSGRGQGPSEAAGAPDELPQGDLDERVGRLLAREDAAAVRARAEDEEPEDLHPAAGRAGALGARDALPLRGSRARSRRRSTDAATASSGASTTRT